MRAHKQISNTQPHCINSIFDQFYSDSSGDEMSNDESSAPEQSDGYVLSEREEDDDKPETDIDGDVNVKKEVEPKTVTLQVWLK